jgi:ATP-dependent Lon protease
VAIGLAWTPSGGEVLFIEARRMNGGGSLTLTGHLGDVMKESARAGLSWFRANASRYGVDPEFYKSSEIHLHVPSGAIPKDGPSAGVTMVVALCSELSKRPVRSDIAMTGEITLSGRVLPVGGIKEKVLAARRVGIREVILPARNEKNIVEDLSEDLRHDMKVHYVTTIDEVLALALPPNPDALAPAAAGDPAETPQPAQVS